MQTLDMTLGYYLAEGPSGLEKLLNDLYEKTQHDLLFASEEHYILYHFGEQKSLIKIDMSAPPFQFWYYDLWGRPAANVVKETIARFLLEKGSGDKYHAQALQAGEHL